MTIGQCWRRRSCRCDARHFWLGTQEMYTRVNYKFFLSSVRHVMKPYIIQTVKSKVKNQGCPYGSVVLHTYQQCAVWVYLIISICHSTLYGQICGNSWVKTLSCFNKTVSLCTKWSPQRSLVWKNSTNLHQAPWIWQCFLDEKFSYMLNVAGKKNLLTNV